MTNGKRAATAEVPALAVGAGGRGLETPRAEVTLQETWLDPLPFASLPPASRSPGLTCWKRGLPSWKGGASVEAFAGLAAAAEAVVAVSAMATDARNLQPF